LGADRRHFNPALAHGPRNPKTGLLLGILINSFCREPGAGLASSRKTKIDPPSHRKEKIKFFQPHTYTYADAPIYLVLFFLFMEWMVRIERPTINTNGFVITESFDLFLAAAMVALA
jgi:hypothetical protein